jgi:hypothetical protein
MKLWLISCEQPGKETIKVLTVNHKQLIFLTNASAFVLVSSPVAPSLHNEDSVGFSARMVAGNESWF